jgi:hypothetical protein
VFESDDSIEPNPDETFYTALIFESVLGVVASVCGWLTGPSARLFVPELGSSGWEPIWMGIAVGVAATLPLVLAIELVKRLPWEPVREIQRVTNEPVFQGILHLTFLEQLTICLCAGVCEELLFRGWLFPWMADMVIRSEFTWSWPLPTFGVEVWGALISSSVLFGLVHPMTKLYVVLTALIGCYFALLLMYSGNLLIPIVAHTLFNAVQLFIAKRQYQAEIASAS